MESNDKFKEIHIKNCPCYYFDDRIKTELLIIFYHMKNHLTIFYFTFYKKV